MILFEGNIGAIPAAVGFGNGKCCVFACWPHFRDSSPRSAIIRALIRRSFVVLLPHRAPAKRSWEDAGYATCAAGTQRRLHTSSICCWHLLTFPSDAYQARNFIRLHRKCAWMIFYSKDRKSILYYRAKCLVIIMTSKTDKEEKTCVLI